MRIILNLKKKREQEVHDGEHKKNSKQRQQKKLILRGTSKGGVEPQHLAHSKRVLRLWACN